MVKPKPLKKLTKQKREEYEEEFHFMFDSSNRPGMNKLKDFLIERDFLHRRASKNYHGAFDGGLLCHSMELYFELETISSLSSESAFIIGIGHDVCKLKGIDKRIKGHGKRSIKILKKFIKLKPVEEACILYHMGLYAAKELDTYYNDYSWNEYNKILDKFPEIIYTHAADMIVSRTIA